MSTMDLISLACGSPANFLDAGGAANMQTAMAAFKIIQGDQDVKSSLINFYGGITRCGVLAHGVVQATKEIGLQDTPVARLIGPCAA